MATTHIIGAGLAGLSAATALTARGRHVAVYEASGQAGGRCRSYEDAAFGGVIDNGNHLLLSGNTAALEYLHRIGAPEFAMGKPEIAFADVSTGKHWIVQLHYGALPRWLLRRDYRRVLRPIMLSALNTHPREAAWPLMAAIVRRTLLKGGRACVPLVAEGLSSVFVDPALQFLAAHNAQMLFHHRLRSLHIQHGRAAMLDFTDAAPVPLGPQDSVICAVPPWAASSLLPGIPTPDEYRAILNAHFCIAPPSGFPRILGVVGGTAEWVFAFPDRISITVSGADHLMQEERELLAMRLWQEVAALTGLPNVLPPWQIVKEKRATFAATPAQNAHRPGPRTPWPNVFLAGDWVQTGLPATIEGAVFSGQRAVELVMRSA